MSRHPPACPADSVCARVCACGCTPHTSAQHPGFFFTRPSWSVWRKHQEVSGKVSIFHLGFGNQPFSFPAAAPQACWGRVSCVSCSVSHSRVFLCAFSLCELVPLFPSVFIGLLPSLIYRKEKIPCKCYNLLGCSDKSLR